MYVAGWTQGLMWQQFNEDGTLKYGNFLQTVTILKDWLYPLRAFGGTLYLIGSFLLVINIWKTVRSISFVAYEEVQAIALRKMSKACNKGETDHGYIVLMPKNLNVLYFVDFSI